MGWGGWGCVKGGYPQMLLKKSASNSTPEKYAPQTEI
jgi:hypothetical protein